MMRSEQEFHDAILRRDFESFLRRCLMTLNPGSSYLPNWHIAAIAYQLERIRRGEITRLIINLPPRHLKSLTVFGCFYGVPAGPRTVASHLRYQLRQRSRIEARQ
jgi:hypothetical protein